MNTIELLRYAWGNSYGILSQTTANLTQEQCDWTPPGIVHSIGTLYWHTISSTDHLIHGWCQSKPALVDTAGWKEKVVVSPPKEEGKHAATLQALGIDLAAMHDYAQAVNEAVTAWLASLTPKDLERTIETPIGELNLAQLVQSFVIWHVDAHCGEISALKGCQGAKGYPF